MKQNSEQKDQDMHVSPTCGKPLVMGSTVNIGVIEGINRVHHLNFLNNNLPDKCANLLIADPPYFEVKGAFDFVWEDMKAYLLDVEKWAKECKRLLADNGTLFWFGDAKNIAYSQVIFDMHFTLLNSLVWENTNDHKQQIRFSDRLRTFAPLTERILMYGNENDLSFIMNDLNLFKSIRDYFQEERKKTSLSYKEINEKCFSTASNGGGMASNILTSYKDGWTFPTKEKYEALQKIGICQKPYIDLKIEYDYLREQEEIKRRPFKNFRNFGDVIRIPNYETADYNHETIKPEELQRTLIMTCSRPNDLVIVPFAGSGTEVAMSIKESRRAIGFDIESKYVEMSNKRIFEILRKPELFQ